MTTPSKMQLGKRIVDLTRLKATRNTKVNPAKAIKWYNLSILASEIGLSGLGVKVKNKRLARINQKRVFQ